MSSTASPQTKLRRSMRLKNRKTLPTEHKSIPQQLAPPRIEMKRTNPNNQTSNNTPITINRMSIGGHEHTQIEVQRNLQGRYFLVAQDILIQLANERRVMREQLVGLGVEPDEEQS